MSGDKERLKEGLGVLAGALRTNEFEDCESEVEGDITVFVADIEVLIMVELLTTQGGGVEAIGGQL